MKTIPQHIQRAWSNHCNKTSKSLKIIFQIALLWKVPRLSVPTHGPTETLIVTPVEPTVALAASTIPEPTHTPSIAADEVETLQPTNALPENITV